VTLLVLAGAAALLRRRRWRSAGAGVTLLALFAAPPARAGGFTNERQQPSAGAHDVLGVESALVPPHLAVSGAAYLSYADEPLRLTAADSRASLVAGQTTLTVGASLGLLDRFELALALPVSAQRAGQVGAYGPGLTAPSGAGVGDLLVVPKAQLFAVSGLSAALALPVTLPTGSRDAYLGHGSVTVGPRAILEYEVAPGLRLAGNAGLALRSASKQLDLEVGNAVSYAVAAEVPFRLARQRMSAVASLGGEAQLGAGGGDPGLEALAGVAWHGPLGLAVTLGGGPGLTHGYGTPRYRVLTAIAFTPGSAVGARRGEVLAASVSPGPALRPTAPEPEVAPPSVVAPAVAVTVAPAAAPAPLDELPRRLGAILFAFASEKLREDAAPELDRIAAAMMAEPSLPLRIEGHADRRGPASYNQVLSERRARAVRDALARRGIAAQRMQVAGFGATKPIDSGRNLKAYARNRRVETEADRAGAMAKR
jgi:outer membrane protein OmpA-like peptidoglycan-associated protein